MLSTLIDPLRSSFSNSQFSVFNIHLNLLLLNHVEARLARPEYPSTWLRRRSVGGRLRQSERRARCATSARGLRREAIPRSGRSLALATMFHCVWQSASVCKRQGVATFCRTANTAYRHWSLRPTTIFRIAYYVRSRSFMPRPRSTRATWFLSLAFLSPSLSLALSVALRLSPSSERALQSC